MKPGVVILPKVFPPASVELGQLLPNPLYPTVRALRPAADAIPSTAVIESEPEKDFKILVLLRNERHFNTKVLRLLEAKLGAGQADYLHITSDESGFKSLRDPDGVFVSMCQGDQSVRVWMQDMAVYGKPFYMVVGIQTVKNASFARMAVSTADAEIKASAGFDPSGLLAMEMGGGGNSAGVGAATAKTTGVLGIQVRRVDCQIKTKEQWIRQRQQQKSQQTTLLPVILSDHVHWAYSYQQKKGGPGDQTEQQVFAEIDQELSKSEDLEELFQAEIAQQLTLLDSDED